MSRLRVSGSGVEKRFGRVAALRGIDFEIAPGESVAILGANGAGKSTWLRILAGLAKPSAGRFEAAADGAPLAREALRGRIGYVGHATLLHGELTARENLAFAARLHGLRPERRAQDALLAELGLEEVAERRVATLSRGTAQRVSIARSVVHEPDLLLLDEPFTGLDELSAARLSNQLAGLSRSGRSLVVVTHDPARACELADRVLVLHRGRICARATRGGSAPATDEVPFETNALRECLLGLARADAIGGADGGPRPSGLARGGEGSP